MNCVPDYAEFSVPSNIACHNIFWMPLSISGSNNDRKDLEKKRKTYKDKIPGGDGFLLAH